MMRHIIRWGGEAEMWCLRDSEAQCSEGGMYLNKVAVAVGDGRQGSVAHVDVGRHRQVLEANLHF